MRLYNEFKIGLLPIGRQKSSWKLVKRGKSPGFPYPYWSFMYITQTDPLHSEGKRLLPPRCSYYQGQGQGQA